MILHLIPSAGSRTVFPRSLNDQAQIRMLMLRVAEDVINALEQLIHVNYALGSLGP